MPASGPGLSAPPSSGVSRKRSRLIAGLLGVGLAAAVAFVLFGSLSNQVTDPIARAATVSSSSSGYRMEMSMQVTSPALGAAISAHGSGTVDLRDRASSFSLTMDLGNTPQIVQALGGSTMRVELIVDGAVVYVKLPASLTARLPAAGKQWIKVDVAKLASVPGLSSLASNPTGNDPRQMLHLLEQVSGSVQQQGTQVVDGVQTTHYQAQLSLQRLADTVPGADRNSIDKVLSILQQSGQATTFPVDVWVDQQQRVRRMSMTIDLSLGETSIHETVTIDLSHYGPQPRPAEPPPGDVYTIG